MLLKHIIISASFVMLIGGCVLGGYKLLQSSHDSAVGAVSQSTLLQSLSQSSPSVAVVRR